MEMMQMLPSGPQSPGPVPGKMPAAEGNELFRNLLNRLQAAGIERKMAEEGDPVLLAAWLTPAFPADTSGRLPTAAAEEGMADSWISSLSTGNASLEKAAAGSCPGPGTDFSGIAGSFSGEPDPAGRQTEGRDKMAALFGHEGSSQAVMKNSGSLLPGLPHAGLEAAKSRSGQALPAPSAQPENRGREAGDAAAPTQGLGIFERRFADILRPVEAVFSRSLPGESHAVLHAATVSGEPPSPLGVEAPAGEAALRPDGTFSATGTIEQGEFPLSRDTRQGDAMETGVLLSDRTAATTALSTSTEGAVLKQPLGRTVTESQILDQVIGRMAVDRNHEASRMSIKLQPEELGRIEIDLTVEQGRIKAQIVAQSQQVQEVLERHLPRLREALEQQGLKLDQLQVSVDAQAGDGRGFSQQHRQAEDHGRPWFGSQPAALAAEREEVPPPAVSPLGKVSLRI
jgi:hypothetical protein